jgi:hypothetical protein
LLADPIMVWPNSLGHMIVGVRFTHLTGSPGLMGA